MTARGGRDHRSQFSRRVNRAARSSPTPLRQLQCSFVDDEQLKFALPLTLPQLVGQCDRALLERNSGHMPRSMCDAASRYVRLHVVLKKQRLSSFLMSGARPIEFLVEKQLPSVVHASAKRYLFTPKSNAQLLISFDQLFGGLDDQSKMDQESARCA
jgi:hypothetical protein